MKKEKIKKIKLKNKNEILEAILYNEKHNYEYILVKGVGDYEKI